MKNNPVFALLAALAGALSPGAAPARLTYSVVIIRHGVRSPTWDAARLNQYSAQPWPNWGVAPGELTPHGRDLMRILGAWYRQWLTGEGLYRGDGCQEAKRVYVWADTDHRTLESGRLFVDALLPGCGTAVHSVAQGHRDPIFKGREDGVAEQAAQAVRERLGPQPAKLIADHAAAFGVLCFILGENNGLAKLMQSPVEVEANARSVALTGPLAAGSSLSEDLLLEYANGMSGAELGWGRLTKENLFQVLELHSVYTDVMRRTPAIARARGSDLLARVLCSLKQAVSGTAVPGALGNPGDALLILAGHDTNLSNLSGMLGVTWHLPGYWPNDTPPGGALVFSLWRDSESGESFVRTRYQAPTLEQIRNGDRLSVTSGPAGEELSIPGCGQRCSWEQFQRTVRDAIDPASTIAGARH